MTEPETDPADPFADLLAQAGALLDLDAARAEAWASGLLADWTDHDGLTATLAASDDPRAGAVAAALAPMLPAARAAVDAIAARGVALPPFADHVGSATPIGAWAIHDRHGDGTSVVVEYEHADGERHDMLVELAGDVAVDLLVGPPGVVEAARDSGERRFELTSLAIDAALERIRAGMQRVLDGEVALITDAYLLNHALVAVRVGLPIAAPDVAERDAIYADRADDAWAAVDPDELAFARATLQAALARRPPARPDAAVVAAAADAWRAAYDRGVEDAIAVADDARVERSAVDDITALVRIAGAYVAPGPRGALTPAAAAAVDGLEAADWLGAVLSLVRAGAGADASPEELVRGINRCPEVTTTIPKRDAPAVASAFACAAFAWRLAGAIDDDGRLTALGAWLLPHALAAAWGATPGEL